VFNRELSKGIDGIKATILTRASTIVKKAPGLSELKVSFVSFGL